MRERFAFAIAAAIAAQSVSSSAEESKFVTTFSWEVKFADGTQTYNENLTLAVNVWLPPSQVWQCVRPPPSIVDGRKRGSFSCSNDGWKSNVLTMIGCKVDEVDRPRTAAMRLFAPRSDGQPQGSPFDGGSPDGGVDSTFGKFIDLTVTCETRPR